MKGLRKRHGRARRHQYVTVTESVSGERTGSRGKWMSLREAARTAGLYARTAMATGRASVVRVLDDDGNEVLKVRIG